MTTIATPATSTAAVTTTRAHCSGKTAGRRGARVLRRSRRHMADNVRVEEAFGIVIFGVVIVATIVAVITLTARNRAYDEIGRGGLSLDRPEPERTSATVRDEEIRQMLTAGNERRARRGLAPLDVDAELARLTRGGAGGAALAQSDPELVAEVRSLVIARNARRVRRGEAPLDVEAEVRRQLADLS
jgi:hypothetical protein